MTGNKQKIEEMQTLLSRSEVFPKHIRSMLLENLTGLTPKVLDLLFEILREEKRRLATLA
jgi:hypothetical protein